jgi:hypothetical protein
VANHDKIGFITSIKQTTVELMNAIEATGIVDADGQLRLDELLPVTGPSRVRVIILVPDASELSEAEWSKEVTKSPSFDFLRDPKEDVYTLNDGKPFNPRRLTLFTND